MVREWTGKELFFPSTSLFVIGKNDTINLLQIKADYRIVSYVDSEGCMSCKLQLPYWKKIIAEIDSIKSHRRVSFFFYFYPQKRSDLHLLLERYNFAYPICVDENDSLNKLNQFPKDMMFHTFLLDANNKILAIGNPVLNLKVKELYLKIIRGEEVGGENKTKVVKTKLNIDHISVSLGSFDWKEEQKTAFVIKNTGDNLLVIEGVSTSCGCTTVAYSKEPVQPGKEKVLEVSYKAEHPEHFNKTITVYCNVEISPLVLQINGDAK